MEFQIIKKVLQRCLSVTSEMSQSMCQKNIVSGTCGLVQEEKADPCHFVKPCNNCSFLPTFALHLYFAGKSPWGSWGKIAIYFTEQKEMSLVCRPGGCEKDVARSCWRADWCPNRRWVRWIGKVGGLCIVMSTHPDRAQIWLFRAWQASDFSPPTAAGIRGV